MLEKGTSFEAFIKILDSKTRITVWKSEKEKIFDGLVYQLYDREDFKEMYVERLHIDTIIGVSVIVGCEKGV